MMASTQSPPDPALQQRLQQALGDDYMVEGLLGRGGFGLVFAARDHRLQRDVAIKLLRPELAAPILRERFRREAEAAAGLRHPNIVPIFGIGEAGDLCWFIMPRIAGETLRGRLEREGRLPVAEARRILAEMALALSAAHAAGLIHRDVKPDNILLEGAEGRVALTDFGIAKSLSIPADATGALTTGGLIVGTPDYMSPEQAGGADAIDARSDIYALGVVGYQLLTGELPFRAAGAGGVLLQQLRGPAPSVSRKRPECPPSIAEAVDRCLMLERTERWATTEAFGAALVRSSVPIDRLAHIDDATEGIRDFRRLAIGVLGVTALAMLIDGIRGAPFFSPVAILLGLALLATRYGALWTRGHGWRELLARQSGRGEPASGSIRPALQQARSDRATMLRLLEEWPRTERQQLAGLPEAIDEAVARVEAVSEELERVRGEQAGATAGVGRERHDRRLAELRQQLGDAAEPLGRLALLIREIGRGGPGARIGEVKGRLAEVSVGRAGPDKKFERI